MSRYLNDFEEDYILRVIMAYLFDGKSHRQIQREILGLPAPANGGGFIVMDILHNFDIRGDKKGILQGKNISEMITNSTDELKTILRKI